MILMCPWISILSYCHISEKISLQWFINFVYDINCSIINTQVNLLKCVQLKSVKLEREVIWLVWLVIVGRVLKYGFCCISFILNMCQSLNLFYVLNATTILRVINSDQLKIILYSFVLYIYILNLESSHHPQKKSYIR